MQCIFFWVWLPTLLQIKEQTIIISWSLNFTSWSTKIMWEFKVKAPITRFRALFQRFQPFYFYRKLLTIWCHSILNFSLPLVKEMIKNWWWCSVLFLHKRLLNILAVWLTQILSISLILWLKIFLSLFVICYCFHFVFSSTLS